MSLLKIYGAELKKLREAKGYSLEYVAEHLNLEPQQIQRTEEGLRDISMENIQKYAELYGVTSDDVFKSDYINVNSTDAEYVKLLSERFLGPVADLVTLFYANRALAEKHQAQSENSYHPCAGCWNQDGDGNCAYKPCESSRCQYYENAAIMG